MRRSDYERWSTAFGVFAIGGIFYYYTLFAIDAPVTSGYFESQIHAVVQGHENAPYQYRFLVPHVLVWLIDHTSYSLQQVRVLIDGGAIALGFALGLALLRRAGLAAYALPALLYCGLLMTGIFLYPQPETTVTFVAVTAALVALQRRPSGGWWGPSVAWPALVVAATVLMGCRTDLLVALAVGFGTRWWRQRQPADAVVAVALAVAGAAATAVIIHHYSGAHYRGGTSVVQLRHNLHPMPALVLACFLLPVLGPFVVALRHSVSAIWRAAADELPLLALVASQLVAIFAIGRAEETRLLFPLAIPLAWIGASLWRALITSVETTSGDSVVQLPT